LPPEVDGPRNRHHWVPGYPTDGGFLHSLNTGRPLEDYERFVQTLKTKSPQGFRSSSKEFPDETHSGMALLALIDALRHLYHGYRFHNDLLPKGLAYAEQHFKDVSKKVGWPLAIPESVINEFGYAALSQGKTSDAIGLFKRNVEANPNSANAYDGLADGYAKAGQWKDAVEASEKAVALATQFSNPKRSYFIEQAKKMNDRLKQAPGPSKWEC
jgi:tetratricopeptide (TPR) repeat protein